jgi:hypothetical protein
VRRTRHDPVDVADDLSEQAALTSETGDPGEPVSSNGHAEPHHPSRRAARGERRVRPRAPRAEKGATSPDSDSAGLDTDKLAEDSPPASDASVAAAEALVIDLSGKKPNRGRRTAKRARRKQEDAAAALRGSGDDNPALGALNRHLNMMMQQLGTAHRLIGRIAAERDALRQQLADLQGVPVEEIVVTSLGAPAIQPTSAPKPVESKPPTGISRFNYFGGDDVALMRKRRQTFVLGLLLIVLILGFSIRMGAVQMPDKFSRDSLSGLPFIGDFMAIFLAGWMFFRVIRVGSKGVKWVFPSDDPRRRRR